MQISTSQWNYQISPVNSVSSTSRYSNQKDSNESTGDPFGKSAELTISEQGRKLARLMKITDSESEEVSSIE